MYVYNFSLHIFNDCKGYMYVYDETEGGRGAEDVSSCIVKHLKEKAVGFKHIVLFCDSCGGQNRNIKIALSLLKFVQNPDMEFETIDIKYMIPGHSYLPNDADFGIIEKAIRKLQSIFTPDDWFDVIRKAKIKAPVFEVVPMQRCEFISTSTLEEVVDNRKTATDGTSVNWLQIRWLRFEKTTLSR